MYLITNGCAIMTIASTEQRKKVGGVVEMCMFLCKKKVHTV